MANSFCSFSISKLISSMTLFISCSISVLLRPYFSKSFFFFFLYFCLFFLPFFPTVLKSISLSIVIDKLLFSSKVNSLVLLSTFDSLSLFLLSFSLFFSSSEQISLLLFELILLPLSKT